MMVWLGMGIGGVALAAWWIWNWAVDRAVAERDGASLESLRWPG